MAELEHQIAALKEKLLTMAGHAESSVHRAVRAVMERDDELALQVKRDDDLLDRLEMEIDDAAIELLAGALADDDLRLIAMAMKISHDLERVGDEATAIARRAIALNRELPLRLELDLPRLAGLATGMLKDALDAFVRRDSAKARAVVPRDRDVDQLNRQFQDDLAAHMSAAPDSVHRCLSLVQIAKRLERIADHAANIAEDVVYLCEARDIRHPVLRQRPDQGAGDTAGGC
jgi:phosphate transport system protein